MFIRVLSIIFILLGCSFLYGQVPLSADPPAEAPVAVPVDRILSTDGSAWSIKSDDFMRTYGRLGFRWTSKTEHSLARAYGVPLTFMGYNLMEAQVRFRDGQMSEVVFSIYNRGDAGESSKEKFVEAVSDLQEKLSAWTKVRPVKVTHKLQSSGVKKDARAWSSAHNQAKLEWSYSLGSKNKQGYTFRPEYIRLQLQPSDSKSNYASSIQSKRSMSSGVSRSMLKANVKTDSSGDVYIDGVPMVDQGSKGYCVVATMERVMRYYGREVDQHEMAQIAQTQTAGGTSVATMIDALRKLGLKLGCKVLIHEDWDWKSYQRMIRDYNSAARKSGDPFINLPTSGTINIGEINDALLEGPWLTAKMKKKADYGKFKSVIMKYTKQGIPMAWSVYTGVFEEKPPLQGRGGHMRMIIGYNSKTAEVIYTDSWGAGHELKRMKMDNAWTMTDGLYTIEPRSMTF